MNTFRYAAGVILVALLWSCQPSDEMRAKQLVDEAYREVQAGQWHRARMVLDSVHGAYPREVEQRRRAKLLSDSITYLEAQRTYRFADSMLTVLLPQTDPLIKQFRYEKNAAYEDHGKYVHRLLATGSNTSRCFLQAYVRDDRVTVVKSYYYGAHPVNQHQVVLSGQDMESVFRGSNHRFEAEGWHEIMTMEDSVALQLLNFISSHSGIKIRVHGEGDSPTRCWTYYLQTNEVEALTKTYQLGFLMKDIRTLEHMQKKAASQIQWWQNKYVPAP